MDLEELLDRLYSEPSLEKRRYIPDKLAKIGDWSSTNPLGELIVDPTQPEVMRNEAVESLGKQGDPRAISYLKQVLDDPVNDIRRTAVWSLGQIGVPEAVDPVFSMTDDENGDVRRWVAKSAGRIRSDEVPKHLKKYMKETPLNDLRVVADIIRAASSQIDRIPLEDYQFWEHSSYQLLDADIPRYVKQAAMILLNNLFARGVEPASSKLLSIYDTLPDNDPLIRPLIIEAMGYAGKISFLEELSTPYAIKALGIATAVPILERILEDATDDQLIAVLEAYCYTDEAPDLTPYYDHPNLTVRTQALEVHARRGLPIERVHEAYNKGESRYKLLEIYRYYGKEAVDVLETAALESDKVARQNSVYSLISDEMLDQEHLHAVIRPILEEVAKNDRIWHIRRDARIGIERIDHI